MTTPHRRVTCNYIKEERLNYRQVIKVTPLVNQPFQKRKEKNHEKVIYAVLPDVIFINRFS